MMCPKCFTPDLMSQDGEWKIKFINGYLRQVCETCGFIDDRRSAWIRFVPSDGKKYFIGNPETNPNEAKKYNLIQRMLFKLKRIAE